MALLALFAGADTTLTIGHHVLRIVVVIFGTSFAAKLFSPKRKD